MRWLCNLFFFQLNTDPGKLNVLMDFLSYSLNKPCLPTFRVASKEEEEIIHKTNKGKGMINQRNYLKGEVHSRDLSPGPTRLTSPGEPDLDMKGLRWFASNLAEKGQIPRRPQQFWSSQRDCGMLCRQVGKNDLVAKGAERCQPSISEYRLLGKGKSQAFGVCAEVQTNCWCFLQ